MVTIRDDGMAEFTFYRPNANHVFLAGDFNNWCGSQLKMVQQGNGYWTLRVALPAGQYKFRYVADGYWYTDYAAFGVEPGRFGFDSVLLMPAQALRLRAQDGARQQAAAA